MLNKLTLNFIIPLALSIAACSPVAITASPPAPTSLPPEITAAPALPPPFPQVQTVTGLEVELLNARILDGQLTIDICHLMPTQEDWIVGPDAEDAYVTNKLLIHIAGRDFGHFAILIHEGRKSGMKYRIPVIAEPLGDGFVIA